MMNSKTLLGAAHEVRSAAQQIGAFVVSVIPGGPRMAELVAVERAEFLALITHLAPKIVYLHEVRCEPATLLASLIDEEDEDSTNDPDVQAAAKRWKRYEGDLCQFIAVVVHDGIHHGYDEEVGWIDEMRIIADRLRERRDEQISTEAQTRQEQYLEEHRLERDQQARETAALIQVHGATLKADPRFDQSLTKTKRRQLAALLFPDLPSVMLTKIVDLTVSADWLSPMGT